MPVLDVKDDDDKDGGRRATWAERKRGRDGMKEEGGQERYIN